MTICDNHPRTAMRTLGGHIVDFASVPDVSVIDLDEIVWSLGGQPRWTGHTLRWFPLAQHCCVVGLQCSEAAVEAGADPVAAAERALCGTAHDFSEAYTGDPSSPLKRTAYGVDDMLGPCELKLAITRIERAVALKLGLPAGFESHPDVKAADRDSLAWENLNLRTERNRRPTPDAQPLRPGALAYAERELDPVEARRLLSIQLSTLLGVTGRGHLITERMFDTTRGARAAGVRVWGRW